jgi:hypothetical protein
MSILTVGVDKQFTTITAAIAASQDGDTVQVDAGNYVDQYANINISITLQAVGGMVNMISDMSIPNGKAIFVTNGNITIDGFSFSGAFVPDNNGAGIRYETGNLTLTNDYFHDNQEGLLGGLDPNGTLTIDNTEFDHNGDGSGFTHNLYVAGAIANLIITDSYFHDAVVGHEIKSRALNTSITNSRIQDEGGSASYSIDAPNGGNVIIQNNVIEQGPATQNPTIIAFGEEGAYANSTISVSGNTILNDLASGSALGVWNATSGTAQLTNNSFYGLTASRLVLGPNTQSGNTFLTTEPALDESHPFGLSPPPPPASPPPPPPPSSISPDGTILTAGSGGSLVTSAGTWTFGTTTTAYGNLILLDGQSAAGGSAVELEVANNGKIYADNLQGQWWQWNGSGWGASSNPTLSPPPPPPASPPPPPPPPSGGRILTVGPGQQFSTIAGAINASQNGDTINVQAGTYVNDYATITTDITLQGVGGMVNMVSTGLIPNGKAIFITSGNDTINNFSFSGAQVTDGNGAGIRYEGGNLILNNDYFHDNQEGLLSNFNPAGSITINNSEFAHNGDGSGFTHNLYVSDIGTLTINNSYFHDAVVGHEIKSRAENTIITNSRIQDENGSASYSIDLPNGGNAVIENNIIQQGPNSQNPTIIAYGEEGNNYANSQLTVDFNTFLNDLTSSSVLGVWNSTSGTAEISGNQFYGLTSSQIAAGPDTQTGNTFLTTEPALVTTHPWSS